MKKEMSYSKKKRLTFGLLVKLLILPILFVGFLKVIKSLDYTTPNFSQGFLINKEEVFQGIYKYAFYIHILASPLALFTGTVNAFFRLEQNYRKWHRVIGTTFLYLVLCLVAPSGLIMSFYAFGGTAGVIGFLVLSVLLFLFAFKGFKSIREQKIQQHQQFMIRAYILMLSAIWLRIFSFVTSHYFEWYGETKYAVIAWASWLPFLLIYEALLYRQKLA